jgi:hypothetical protein
VSAMVTPMYVLLPRTHQISYVANVSTIRLAPIVPNVPMASLRRNGGHTLRTTHTNASLATATDTRTSANTTRRPTQTICPWIFTAIWRAEEFATSANITPKALIAKHASLASIDLSAYFPMPLILVNFVTVVPILAILATALQILANVNAKKSFVVPMTARHVPMAITIIPTASLVTALPTELS